MVSKFIKYKNKAIVLRKKGFTYGEIKKSLGVDIAKSTLREWFRDISLSDEARNRLEKVVDKKIRSAHKLALEAKKKKREKYLSEVKNRVKHLKHLLFDKDIAKIILAVLYLGEGSKGARRAFVFGNSDPKVIELYLSLLRKCYIIDESKFRCTLQCRADQNIPQLEKFWSKITGVPLSQFYKARIDPRTIGKKSRKSGYKGVCRIDYFSAEIYTEIEKIIEVVCSSGL